MYGILHIRPVSVGLDSQIWYLFIYITGYLNVRKIYETMDFRTFVGPLVVFKGPFMHESSHFGGVVLGVTGFLGFLPSAGCFVKTP